MAIPEQIQEFVTHSRTICDESKDCNPGTAVRNLIISSPESKGYQDDIKDLTKAASIPGSSTARRGQRPSRSALARYIVGYAQAGRSSGADDKASEESSTCRYRRVVSRPAGAYRGAVHWNANGPDTKCDTPGQLVPIKAGTPRLRSREMEAGKLAEGSQGFGFTEAAARALAHWIRSRTPDRQLSVRSFPH